MFAPLRWNAALALTLLATLAQAQPYSAAPPLTHPSEGRCAVPSPTEAELRAVRAETAAFVARHGTPERGGPVTVPVAVHVIRAGTSPSQGDVPDQWIEDQVAVLNASFDGTTGGADTGFRFALDVVTRTTNATWYTGCYSDPAPMKQALAHSPATHLNLYACRPAGGILGFAVYPWSYPEDDYRHGVVIHNQTMPGGDLAPYNEGDLAVHEVGHYLGLLHTYGVCDDDEPPGCEVTGDLVCDTPSALFAAGCPVGLDTCPGGGPDPIHNFMHATDDACMYEFTAGQAERMHQMVALYKPTLLLGGCEQSLTATLDDATPAPGQTVTFTVTVSNGGASPAPLDLWLDVTGPASRTLRLASGTLPAGATVTRNVRVRVPASAPAGAYAADLRIGTFPGDVCDTEGFTLTVGGAPLAGGTDAAFAAEVEGTLAEGDFFAAAVAAPSAVAVRPNPFRGQAAIRYEVAEATDVRLAVYDVLGREVAVLVEGRAEAGAHSATFDGRGLAAGTYVYRLQVGGEVRTGRVTLLR